VPDCLNQPAQQPIDCLMIDRDTQGQATTFRRQAKPSKACSIESRSLSPTFPDFPEGAVWPDVS
jgi:hypothetical protein